MPSERVTLDMDKTALYVARAAAEAAHMSLGDWLSRVAREHGMRLAAAQSAENERRFPDEPPGWGDHALDRIFGEAEK